MRFLSRRDDGIPPETLERAGLRRGEKVLASGRAVDGTWLLGCRERLVLVRPDQDPGSDVSLPWERVEDASWDRETSRLTLTAIAEFGAERPAYAFELEDPALLLQLLRERVTASIVLQRRVPVEGRLGLTVIGRRSPSGGPVAWMHSYDAGLDPSDPAVVVVADLALAQARTEVGDDL